MWICWQGEGCIYTLHAYASLHCITNMWVASLCRYQYSTRNHTVCKCLCKKYEDTVRSWFASHFLHSQSRLRFRSKSKSWILQSFKLFIFNAKSFQTFIPFNSSFLSHLHCKGHNGGGIYIHGLYCNGQTNGPAEDTDWPMTIRVTPIEALTQPENN